jgi:hypothetical protein
MSPILQSSTLHILIITSIFTGWSLPNFLETEMEIKKFRELYEKKFRKTITDIEIKEFKALKERLEFKLPSEDPLITLIGFEAYDKSLGD